MKAVSELSERKCKTKLNFTRLLSRPVFTAIVMITEDQQVAKLMLFRRLHLTYQPWWDVVTTAAEDSLSKSTRPKFVNTDSPMLLY